MKNALWVLIILILLAGGLYIVTSKPAVAPTVTAPATSTSTGTQEQSTSAPQKPSPNQGATGVYDPNAPQGSPAECAQCSSYSGAQKAQCLASLHC